jgi:hypothetical protein
MPQVPIWQPEQAAMRYAGPIQETTAWRNSLWSKLSKFRRNRARSLILLVHFAPYGNAETTENLCPTVFGSSNQLRFFRHRKRKLHEGLHHEI